MELTGAHEATEAVKRLWNDGRGVVAVTLGEHGCVFEAQGDTEVRHLSALDVLALNTTGCGDIFHGAYAAALAAGRCAVDCLRFASIAAGLSAQARGGPERAPGREVVEDMIRRVAPQRGEDNHFNIKGEDSKRDAPEHWRRIALFNV